MVDKDAFLRMQKATRAGLAVGQARARAHLAFDPIWTNKIMTRDEAYEWLQGVMELSADECHIALFDFEQCEKVIEASEEYLSDYFAGYETLDIF